MVILRSKLSLALLLLSSISIASAAIPETAEIIPVKIAQSTLRLKLENADGEWVTTGWGAAFGIDLTAYGASDAHYLLSAAHLVLNKNGKGLAPGDLRVEVPVNGIHRWAICKVVAVDSKNDVCLLRADIDVPVVSKLARGNAAQSIGETVMIVGCPSGVPPCVSVGRLTDKKPKVEGKLWEAEAKFDHGNSGGPVFNPREGTVIGVAVAGVSNGQGDMFHDTALFLPMSEIQKFLEKIVAPLLVMR